MMSNYLFRIYLYIYNYLINCIVNTILYFFLSKKNTIKIANFYSDNCKSIVNLKNIKYDNNRNNEESNDNIPLLIDENFLIILDKLYVENLRIDFKNNVTNQIQLSIDHLSLTISNPVVTLNSEINKRIKIKKQNICYSIMMFLINLFYDSIEMFVSIG